ncbi:MAG: sigma-70 family RNA polymerase sigma factor [Oscillospiraceae bacterium]|nr:sigma-70 family RNA polymerase sigma factor [Oscillospiraceae bacterium]
MTNEELALKVKSGDSNALSQLWEQNSGLAYIFARRRYNQLVTNGNTRGVELEDLKQAAFLALVRAVEYYDPEKGEGGAFNTVWDFYVKSEFGALLGTRTSKRDPLNNCTSLDTPLSDDADAETLEAIIPDPTDEFEEADARMWLEQLHDAIEKVLTGLNYKQNQAIRLHFYDGLNQTEAAARMETTRDSYRALFGGALRKLRRPENWKKLSDFIDLRTNFYRTGSAERQTSPVEENVILREELLSAHSWDPFW